MARHHGLIYASVWSDPDWLALSQGAQRLYLLLLSQPKLTLVGLLDYLPSRWARLAADTTLDSIEAAVDELEASRFVAVDRDTDELLIRTFVKHDIRTVLSNKNLLGGMWNAWAAIESRQLRAEAVANIPASVWESPRCQPHPEALQMRRSQAQEPSVQTRGSDPPLEHPSTHHLPPTTDAVADLKQPGNSRGDGPNEAAAVDNSGFDVDDQAGNVTGHGEPPAGAASGNAQPATAPDASGQPSPVTSAIERSERFHAACEILTDRYVARTPAKHNPKRQRQAALRGKVRDYRDDGLALLAQDPTLSPEQLADALEPPPTPASARRNGTDLDPGYQRAAIARAEQEHDRYRTDVLDQPQAPEFGDPQAAADRIAQLKAEALRPAPGA